MTPAPCEQKEEGFWRRHETEDSPLPWPAPDPHWQCPPGFLQKLDALEAVSTHIDWMGSSTCRLCGKPNGHSDFKAGQWLWPQGYRHYIADHRVRPSPAFEAFISSCTPPPPCRTSSSTPP
jgi:hypothetical protein